MRDFKTEKERLLKSRELFEDSEFPADSRSLHFSGDGSPSIVWKRPKEISSNAKFIVRGVSYYDMQQGYLGDCWFVAASVSLAASNWKLFERVVPQDQDFDNDYAGIFRFNFWQYGQWKEIVVDDRLPTRNGHLIYTANKQQPNEFWCPLLEKAYAKLTGCYEAIESGRIHHAFVDMTGGISQLVELQGGISLNSLQEILLSCKKMNTLMGGAIFGQSGASTGETLRRNGLYEGHAYSIVDVREVDFEGKRKMLIRVRNPWGKGEWNGPWSDGASEWRKLRRSDSMTVDHSKVPNGEFWMALEDFKDNFSELELCHLTPDALTSEIARDEKKKQWLVQEFYGSWIRGVSSGGPLTSFTSSLFWKNPQYKIHLANSSSVIVSLMEVTDRRVRDEADVYIGFVIFKLQEGREPTSLSGENYYEFMPKLEKTSGIYWPYRERTMRFELEASTYVIVPFTSRPSMEAEFYLRVMSEEPPNVEPVVTPTGPIGDDMDLMKGTLSVLFRKYSGSDGKVDAMGLRRILSEVRKEEYGSNEGYTLETCRSLVALKDIDVSGLLDLTQVKSVLDLLDTFRYLMEGCVDYKQVEHIWEIVKTIIKAFVSFDRDDNNSIDVYELGDLYRKVGFSLSVDIRKAIVRRYGGREGRLHLEDFIQSFCKILNLHRKFKVESRDGYINMDLSKWIESAVYV